MKKLADVKVDPNEKYGSIDLEKLVGRKILRIEGHPSSEFGTDTMVFQIHSIVFEDGKKVFVEGEHDCPYIPSDDAELNLDNDTLEGLYMESNGEQESDEDFKDRILDVMPEGHTYTAEDLGNASGAGVDAIGEKYGLKRKGTS